MNKFPFDQARVACLDVHSPLYIRLKDDKYGGGDIGDLYALVDKAAEAGFRLIQFNPIHDTANPSPYFSISCFSYNPVFLNIDALDLSDNEKSVKHLKLNGRKKELTSYRSLYNFKVGLLEKYFKKTKASKEINLSKIDPQVLAYALFKTLKKKFKREWVNWPVRYRTGNPKKIIAAHPELEERVKFFVFTQEILREQWKRLAKYAKTKGILFVFDKPIYPIHDSADVWANQKLFYLNPDGSLKYESGCNNPNDPFGMQRWGHAVYRFKEKPRYVIDFFEKSIEHLSKIARIIRLDHTLALIWKYYLINPESGDGFHLPALKHKLFKKLIKDFPEIYFIAEDLGYVSKKNVDLPLRKYCIPGIRCLQWTSVPKYTKISQYPTSSVAMTSNHDTQSLPDWWKHLAKIKKRIFYNQLPGTYSENEASTQEIIRLVFNSPSAIASITLRDLANDFRRYNVPGKKNHQNWRLRCPIALEELNFDNIAKIILESGR